MASAVTTVIECQCGRYILTPEGLEGHFTTCTKLQKKVNAFTSVGCTRNDASSVDVDSCVKLVNFYSPSVSVERMSTLKLIEIKHRSNLKYESSNKTKIETALKKELNETGEAEEMKNEGQNRSSRFPFIDSLNSVPVPQRRRSSLRAAEKLRKFCGILKEESIDCSSEKNECNDKFELSKESDSEDNDVEKYEKVESKIKLKRANRGSFLVADDQYVHKCNVCPTKFKLETDFDWHMYNIHGDGSKNNEIITCPLCGRMLNKRLVFLSHLKSHENAEALEETFDLWNTWPKKPRKGSKASKMILKFSCKYCLIPHISHYSFLTHMKVEHPEKGRFAKYVCKYCGTAEFDSIKLFLLHIRKTHPKDYYGETIKWTFSDPLHQDGRPKGQCDVCKKMFDVFYLRTHKEKIHKSKPDDQNQGNTEMLESNNGFYNCPMSNCRARVKNKFQLKNHFILHLQNNLYACPVPGCDIKCDAQCHLDRHMRLHTSQLDKTCSKCGVSYSRIDKLKNHVCCFDKSKLKWDENGRLRRISSHSRLQRVQINDQIQQSSTIKKHININEIFISDPVFIEVCKDNPKFKELILGCNGIKTSKNGYTPRIYKCENCFTSFHERTVLEKHNSLCQVKQMGVKNENTATTNEMTSTSITSEKVGCPICAKSFENLNLLEDHVQSAHTPSEIFRCPTCKIIFSSKRVKNRHMLSCQIRRPFKCQKCSSRFSTQILLDNHLEKGHCTTKSTCSKCGKILVNPTSLARHWLLIHGVKVKSKRSVPERIIKKKPTKRKKDVRKAENPNTSPCYSSTCQRGKVVHEDETRKLDYSLVKIETEPELNIYDCDNNINSEQVPENIKMEPLEGEGLTWT